MQIRRLLFLLALAVSLAGIIIWFTLQRESIAFAPSFPPKVTNNAVPSESSRLIETDSESRESALSPARVSNTYRHRSAQKQIDWTPPKRFLQEERRLIANSQLNQDAVKAMLNSPQFEDFMREMRDEMESDTAASDVGELYIGAIRDSLLEAPGLHINEFACGLTICAGSIDAAGENLDWDQWTKTFDADTHAPTYVFADVHVDRGDGVVEHRIVFSTDPASNAITGTF